MKADNISGIDFDSIRSKAEELAGKTPGKSGSSAHSAEITSLLDELEIRKIEQQLIRKEVLELVQDRGSVSDRPSDLFDVSPAALLVVSLNFEILEINRTALEMIGLERNQLVDKPFIRIIHQDDREMITSFLERLAQKPEAKEVCEARIGSEGTATFYALLGGNSYLNDPRIHIAVTDISGKYLAEKELEEQVWKYRSLADFGQALIWTSGLDAKCNYFNNVWLTFTGRTMEQELGDGWAEGVHPEDLQQCVATYLSSFNQRLPFSMMYRLRHNTGEFRWILDDGNPTFDQEGHFTGYIGHCLDIHEQVKDQEKLLKLSEAIDQSPVLTIITNREGVIEFVNPKVMELSGYAGSELLGENPRIFKSGKMDKDSYIVLYETLSRGQTWKGEFYNRKKNGEYYWVSASISPVRNISGEITHYMAIEEDITEQKNADRIIREFNSSLEVKIYERTRELNEANISLEKEVESRIILEKELADEKKRLYDILKGTNAGTWEWNIQTGETIFNERWAEIIGYTLDELAPVSIDTWMKYAHPEDLVISGQLLEEHFKGVTDSYSFESRMKHKDGNWVWVLDRGKVHKWDDSGKPLLMSGIHLDITKRKITEEKLRWNQSLLNLMSESSPLGFLVVDNRTDDILYVNKHFCKIWNIEHLEEQMRRGEIKNNDIIPHCIPVLADVPAFAESCKPLQSEENRQVVEDFIEFTENRTIQRFSTQIRGENDEYYGRFYIFEDITAQVNSKKLIEQTRQNYETFFNTIDEFLWVLDQDGHIIHMNTTVKNRLGYTEDELYNKPVLMVHPPDRRDEAGQIVGEMLGGITEFCSVPIMTKSGHPIPVETRVKPGNWDGKPVIFGVSKDVSKIKLSEEKFSRAFQSNGALMSISGFEDGKIIDVNQTFLDTLGYSRDEVIGKSSLQLDLFLDKTIRSRLIERIHQQNPIRDVEIEWNRKDKSVLVGLLSAALINVGEEICILTMLVDISERKKAEEELKKARIEANQANQAKSEFLSRMSHELRTPMNSILGFAQLLEMNDLNIPQKKAVGHILSSGRHLLHLINEVLELSRIEAGKISLALEPVGLSGLIQSVLDIIHPIASTKNIGIHFAGNALSNLTVLADEQKLRQVLLNLLNNAIKYNNQDGSVTIHVSVIQGDQEDKAIARISISDTGIGISEENISRLFLPFERIGAERTTIEGTGLGLAVSRQLIELMGGTIGAESQAGLGSTFRIDLPLSESKKLVKNSPVENAGLQKNFSRGVILYIEDNLPNIELVQTYLENYFPEIQLITSTTGNNGLEIAKFSNPSLILLDINLPDINGKSVLRNLKKDEATRDIPVVIVSADAMPSQLASMAHSGSEHYLTKPLDLNELGTIIRTYIQ